MNNLTLLFAVLVLFASCKNNPVEQKQTPEEQNAPIGQSLTPEQIEELKKTAGPDVKISENSPLIGSNSGLIDGVGIKVRQEPSGQSADLGVFDDKEVVEFVDMETIQTEGEAIISKPITVKGSGGSLNLPQGSTVLIENYQVDGKVNTVIYKDPKKGTLTAEVDASTIQTFIYSNWIKVKRKNGETGWVNMKFYKGK